MTIQVALTHITSYKYDRRIELGPQIVRLRPAPHSRTRILSYAMRVDPAGHFLNWQQDPNANYLARLVFPEKTDHFRVQLDLVAEMAVLNPFDFFLEPDAETIPFTETRLYVKHVLSNAVYYSGLFTGQPQSLKARLGTIVPQSNEDTDLP